MRLVLPDLFQMNLDAIQTEIRPRLPWEAVDHGVVLARAHGWAMVRGWLVTALPFWILCVVLTTWVPTTVSLTLMVLWWLKPLFAVMPILVLSRKLFGVTPQWRDLWSALGRWLLRRSWWELTLGRFQFRRSVRQIVRVLEGQAPRERVQLFLAMTPQWMVKGVLCLEMALFCGLISVIMYLLPMELKPWRPELGGWTGFRDLLMDPASAQASAELRPLFLVYACSYLLSSMVGELLYLAASFGCYLNTRTELEGWDVEIDFKRMNRRLETAQLGRAAAAGLSVLLALGLSLQPVSQAAQEKAAQPSTAAQQRAQRIKADPDFTIHRYQTLEMRSEETSSSSRWKLPSFLGDILGFLFYAALILAAAWLIWFIIKEVQKSSWWLQRYPSAVKPRLVAQAVAGLDVRPESLPDDPVAVARQLWAAGQCREAMSLLYRAALAWQIHQQQVNIIESDTEGDCVRRVAAEPGSAQREVPLFRRLTSFWLGTAYAALPPAEADWTSLCQAWPFQLKTQTAQAATRQKEVQA
jgi:hypothetical protein